jgi:Leucine-rich repeat (LRR) protein
MRIHSFIHSFTPCWLLSPPLAAFNNCQGTIPNEIRHLEFLDFLSLKHNQLTGSIPPSLRQLKDLDYLDLKNNQLTGTIPRFLGELQQLQVLGLSNNQLSGSLPESLGTLQQLKTLALDDNFLSGGLDPVGKLTNLEFFYAENNVFEGQVNETFFHDFQRLIELDLSNNHLESSSSIPAHIFSLYNLQILDLSENNLQGTLPEAIPPNSVLKYFSLRLNQVLGTIPESISNLRRLQHLDLEANTMKGQLPASLGEMTDLTYLFLGRNPWVAGTIPEEWQSLTKLRELSLDNAKRTGEIPSWLTTEMNHLKLLDLRRNDLTGNIPDGIFLKQLIYLLLSDNKLTGSIPENLGRMAELCKLDVLVVLVLVYDWRCCAL